MKMPGWAALPAAIYRPMMACVARGAKGGMIFSGARATFSRGLQSVPHGGKLVNRMVGSAAEGQELILSCDGLTMELSERQSCDVELITVGGFSPLEGFMNEDVWCVLVPPPRISSGSGSNHTRLQAIDSPP